MQVLDRRSAARRASDQGAGRSPPEMAASNRRRTDRRVSATRKRLTADQIDAVHAGCPTDVSVVRVTYVVNGPCFAWLAEVMCRRAGSFMAGAGVLPENSMPEESLAAVIGGIRARLQVWHDDGRAG